MFSWFDSLVESSRSLFIRRRPPQRKRTERRPPVLLELERRTLLSLSPVGTEFLANNTLAGFQGDPDVAVDEAARIAIVWSDDANVFAQRFDPSGSRQGAEQQLNATSSQDEEHLSPSVAMDDDGDYVVAWERYEYKSSTNYGYDVCALRFDSSGNAQGATVQVNRFRSDGESTPSVAMDHDGDYTVAWARYRYGSSSSDYDILFRPYSSAGTALSNEVKANTSSGGDETRWEPAVAANSNGQRVIVWSGVGTGDFDGIFGRVYDSLGNPIGSEFSVNTTTSGVQSLPAVAMDASGNFVVTWAGNGPGDASGVFARSFNSTGQPLGSEFRINQTVDGSQSEPDIAMDESGNFVIVWSGAGLTDESGVYARYYLSNAQPEGNEFRVNSTTSGVQSEPAVAMNDAGTVVVAWSGNGAGDNEGVFGRIYALPPTVQISASGSTFAENGLPITITISRSGRTAESLQVDTTIGGSALNGLDYTITGNFTISAGASQTLIIVTPLTDLFAEDPETISVSLDSSTSYAIGASNAVALTLLDTDLTSPTITKMELVQSKKNKASEIVLTFSEAVETSGAANLQNYALQFRKKGSSKSVAIVAANVAGNTVTLSLAKAISIKKAASYELTVSGSLTLKDLANNQLDGDANGSAGGDYIKLLSEASVR